MKPLRLFVCGVVGLKLAGAVWAGRPLMLDDAGTVPPGQVEIEAGMSYAHDGKTDLWTWPMAATAGVLPRLEAGLALAAQSERRPVESGGRDTTTGMADMELAAKWHALDADRFWADHALSLLVRLPTGSEGKGFSCRRADVCLMYILTKQLVEGLELDANAGHAWIGDGEDTIHYGVALRWQAAESWELVAEVVTESPRRKLSDAAVGVNLGARWSVNDVLTLDAAAGTKLRGDWPDWMATIGLTWVLEWKKQ